MADSSSSPRASRAKVESGIQIRSPHQRLCRQQEDYLRCQLWIFENVRSLRFVNPFGGSEKNEYEAHVLFVPSFPGTMDLHNGGPLYPLSALLDAASRLLANSVASVPVTCYTSVSERSAVVHDLAHGNGGNVGYFSINLSTGLCQVQTAWLAQRKLNLLRTGHGGRPARSDGQEPHQALPISTHQPAVRSCLTTGLRCGTSRRASSGERSAVPFLQIDVSISPSSHPPKVTHRWT